MGNGLYRASFISHFLMIGGFAASLSVVGCTGTKSTGTASQVSISFPAVNSLSIDSYDFSRACFAVNVKASDIPMQTAGSCGIPLGVFSGFVAPGATLSLNVPKGTSRTLEVFSFLRDSKSAACPTLSDMKSLAPNQVVRVGLVPSFDALTDTATVTVNLSAPAPKDNLITQYSLADSCVVAPLPGTSAAITNGSRLQTGGNYVISGTVSGQSNVGVITGGNYQIRLTRQSGVLQGK